MAIHIAVFGFVLLFFFKYFYNFLFLGFFVFNSFS